MSYAANPDRDPTIHGLTPASQDKPDGGEVSAFAHAVGHVLRTERKRQDHTVETTATRVGVTLSALCDLELGIRALNMGRLLGLCAVLGVTPAWVITAAQAEAYPLGWPYQDHHRLDAARPCDSC